MQICAYCGRTLSYLNPPFCLICFAKATQQIKQTYGFYWKSPPAKKWYAYSAEEYNCMFRILPATLPPKNCLGELERVVLYPPVIEDFDDETFSEILEYGIEQWKHGPYFARESVYLIFYEVERRIREYTKLADKIQYSVFPEIKLPPEIQEMLERIKRKENR